MKEKVEPLIHDVKIYSDGLILALQNDSFKEGLEYTEEMKKHLDSVESYLNMKNEIKS